MTNELDVVSLILFHNIVLFSFLVVYLGCVQHLQNIIIIYYIMVVTQILCFGDRHYIF